MRKLIAFDLDGTLTPSKSQLPDRLSVLFARLLDHYQVCVISGGTFHQFETQLLSNVRVDPARLGNLHLMPTCGTRYYRYESDAWQLVYAEDFSDSEKQQIVAALQEGIVACGFDQERTWGDQIEDRLSQITFSALGQAAPVVAKDAWDPDNSKKNRLRDYVADKLPDFEVRTGGITSVDITKLGVDKAYGMQRLIEQLGITKDEILFLGDRLQEGGNDYPVKAMGVEVIDVGAWQDTAFVLEGILGVCRSAARPQ